MVDGVTPGNRPWKITDKYFTGFSSMQFARIGV